ncbi:hypothetical protein EDF56_102440 [Novosphingobium sp. PhB165]|uniref:hypothetical protein n=1 Tax=Novosphingobium sp. PhB165 TaxID=2485105 RepID=UPI00104F5530|nr:hypothetical protein [Novosphingobium sp. PhB165]TCM20777.1 hypothetical protein EDF56_102440 [Novosphingobium sp. PhB165]
MEQNDYHVLPQGDRWTVTLHGVALAVFADMKAALNRAIDIAHQAGMAGHEAKVLLIDPFRTSNDAPKWVFGRHPYPPTA